jgi:AcrR family transcriptional regulator
MTTNKKKDERVTEIIRAAIELFLDKGYEGTSMEAIASAANLSKGGLYHHFRNKEEVLITANEWFMAPVNELMNEALHNDNPLDGLTTFIRGYLMLWSSNKKELTFIFLTFTKMMSNEGLWTYMEDYLDEMSGFFTTLLERCVEQGKLKPHDSNGLALSLMSALDGVLIYLTMSKKINPQEVSLHFEEVFLGRLVV